MSHFATTCLRCGRDLEEVFCAFCGHCKGSLPVTTYAVAPRMISKHISGEEIAELFFPLQCGERAG